MRAWQINVLAKLTTAITLRTQAQREEWLLPESSAHGKRLTVAVIFLLISLLCVTMVDKKLARPYAA